jgi:hypothetical protein
MTEREGSGPPQRYCRNCGSELRSGTAFCTSCGADLGPPPLASGPQASWTPSQTQTGTTTGAWRPGPNLGRLRALPGGAARWLRDLPGAPKLKLVLIGLGVLAVLVLLSPVTYVLAALACVLSLVVLAVRAFQRRTVMGWGIAAAASLVLALALGGVSSALYGPGSSETGRGGGSAYPTDSGGNGEDQYATVPGDNAGPAPLQFKEYQIGSFEEEGFVPEYEVFSASDNGDYSTPLYSLKISMGDIDEENLRAIAEETAPQYGFYNGVLIFVYDESLQPYDPVPNSPGPPRSRVDDTPLLRPDATITIENNRGIYRIGFPL